MNSQNGKKIDIFIPEYALSVMNTLREAGEEVYIVGGCVRDALLGKSPNDYDMTVSCAPERTAEILSALRVIPTGMAHGTVTAISEGRPIEITTFRVDGSYTDMRRPDSVSFTRSINEDLARRDFTVNAMAYSHETSLIDLFDGQADLDARVIRAVGDPVRRFTEDALRIMRAFRFSAQLGFEIEEGTLLAAKERKDGLARIAKERIAAEFIRLICSDSPGKPLLQMKELGILPYVTDGYCPEDSVLSLLGSMPAVDIARLGLFFVDCEGSRVAEIMRSLKCSNKQRSGAVAVSQNAKRNIVTSQDATRLRAAIGEHAAPAARASVALGYSEPRAIALTEESSLPSRISDLAVGGKELSALGLCGKEIGDVLEYLLACVIDDPTLNQKEALLELAKKQKEE